MLNSDSANYDWWANTRATLLWTEIKQFAFSLTWHLVIINTFKSGPWSTWKHCIRISVDYTSWISNLICPHDYSWNQAVVIWLNNIKKKMNYKLWSAEFWKSPLIAKKRRWSCLWKRLPIILLMSMDSELTECLPFHQRQQLLPPCVFSQSFVGSEDSVIMSTGDLRIHSHFHHSSHSEGTSVKFTGSCNYFVYSQHQEHVKMGQTPELNLSQGKFGEEKCGVFSLFDNNHNNEVNPV